MAVPHDETYMVVGKTPITCGTYGPGYYNSSIGKTSSLNDFKTWLAGRPDGDAALWTGAGSMWAPYNRGIYAPRTCCFAWAGPSGTTCMGRDYSLSTGNWIHLIWPRTGEFWSHCSVFYGVTIPPPLPVAAFHGTPLSGLWPLSVAFTDDSTGYIDSWLWNFGDGFLSAERNPTHVYSHAGTFTVVLSVTNPSGTNTITKTNYITVADPPPYVNPIWTLKIGPL